MNLVARESDLRLPIRDFFDRNRQLFENIVTCQEEAAAMDAHELMQASLRAELLKHGGALDDHVLAHEIANSFGAFHFADRICTDHGFDSVVKLHGVITACFVRNMCEFGDGVALGRAIEMRVAKMIRANPSLSAIPTAFIPGTDLLKFFESRFSMLDLTFCGIW
jgi:hypothetical protein